MIKDLINRTYRLEIKSIEKSITGAGSDTYFITCENGRYVVKFPCESEINNPCNEPILCEYLLSKGINVSEFIKNVENDYISTDENGRKFHLQKFVEGKMYELNTAPQWLLKESARLLGRIHAALIEYSDLPEGIGKNFFAIMTPQNALQSYRNTLKTAKQNDDMSIISDLEYRIGLMENFPDFHIDTDKLTCRSTHGDYFISQLICGENKINAVIDWTTACVHPVVWEIVRSYVYASPKCINGEIDIPEFIDYVAEYLDYSELNNYDISIMAKLFYYQIAVCDYYKQYYQSKSDNRDIYLHQAAFSTKLMRRFEKNIILLSDTLVSHFAK